MKVKVKATSGVLFGVQLFNCGSWTIVSPANSEPEEIVSQLNNLPYNSQVFIDFLGFLEEHRYVLLFRGLLVKVDRITSEVYTPLNDWSPEINHYFTESETIDLDLDITCNL